jgi:hypothetical protein
MHMAWIVIEVRVHIDWYFSSWATRVVYMQTYIHFIHNTIRNIRACSLDPTFKHNRMPDKEGKQIGRHAAAAAAAVRSSMSDGKCGNDGHGGEMGMIVRRRGVVDSEK